MALLCYSDLEDADHADVSTLHASLASWVLDLLDGTQDRATRPLARYASPREESAPDDTAQALRTINFSATRRSSCWTGMPTFASCARTARAKGRRPARPATGRARQERPCTQRYMRCRSSRHPHRAEPG